MRADTPPKLKGKAFAERGDLRQDARASSLASMLVIQ